MTRIKAAAAYKRVDLESAVASADKHELITLLFKGVIGALAGAEIHQQHDNKDQVRECLSKASRILVGLQEAWIMSAEVTSRRISETSTDTPSESCLPLT